MQQIDAHTLGFIIRYELGRLGKMTLRDMASGHGDTKRRAVELAAEHILHRMKDWEILVPETGDNIFGDLVPGQLERLRARQSQG